jgi:exosortase
VENSFVNPSQSVADLTALRSAAEGNAARLGQGSSLLRAVGLGIPLLLLCAPTVGDLADLWWNGYGFSHGFLVPLVSLYLVWLQGPTLRRIPVAPALWPGLLWLGVATLLLLASQAGGVITTAGISLILVLAGLVLLLGGWGYLRALAFPLAYLIFMTPVLGSLTEPLEWPFQLLTASMSVSMLQALGIPVLLENSIYIILPTVTLEVARECSGAGLLIAVLAIGLPLASLALRAWWSRITLVLSSVMVAIMANWIRLTVMGVYAQAGGKDLHGPYHILQGLFVDWVAFAFLFAGVWLLSRLEDASSTPVLTGTQGSFSGFIVHGAA